MRLRRPAPSSIKNPLLMFETIVEGTRRTLEFARTHEVCKFLITSSGAVYGKQPPEMTHIPEDYPGAPDPMDPNSAYGEGKRAAEMLCRLYARQFGLETKVARCFAFVGPIPTMPSGTLSATRFTAVQSGSMGTARRCAPTSMRLISPSGFGQSCLRGSRAGPTMWGQSGASTSLTWQVSSATW
jgi:nucleoside-diphosphate-sugar epimerase